MDTFGNDLSSGGVVLSRDELIKKRERNGECPTCGQKCYKKKLFKLEPITVTGKVLKGRCLACNPQDPNKEELVACVAVAAPPPSKGRGGSRRGASSSRNLRSSKTKNTSGGGRAGGLASSLPPSDVGTDFRASTKVKSKLKPIMSERVGLKSNDCIDEEEEKAPSSSRRQNGNSSNGGPNRRSSLDKHDSARMGEFLRRKSPRPSETFLDGIDVSKLNVDDDDEHDNNNTNSASKSSGNKWGSAKSAVSRLTREERQALHTLNSDENSFLDIVNIMMMNSMSTHVQAEGLHALSLVHDLDVNMLDECANNCGFEVIISSMGKCFKVRLPVKKSILCCHCL